MAEIISLGLVLAVIALVFVFTLITGNPPTPTSPRVKAKLLSVLPDIPPGVVYELGSGWGTLAFALAGAFPGHAVIGIERSPVPWLVSKCRQLAVRRANLAIERGDFLARPLHDAALVLCYLQPRAMERLRLKLEAELAPGALVLTHTFRLAGWRAREVHEATDIYRTPIYIYRVE